MPARDLDEIACSPSTTTRTVVGHTADGAGLNPPVIALGAVVSGMITRGHRQASR